VPIYAQDTAVVSIAEGRYGRTLSSHFNNPPGNINGGYGLAVCLRALAAEMQHPDPLVISATYLRPAHPGPVEIAVEKIRSGRRHSVGEARLVQNGAEALRVVATFTDLSGLTGRTHVALTPPVLPAPADCFDPNERLVLNPNSVRARTETRWPSAPAYITGNPSGDARAEFWLRLADDEDADVFALASLVDMAAPAVFELGEFSTTTVELTVHLRARPAPGWFACRVSTNFLIGGYHDEDFEMWDSTGQLVAQSRQLQLLVPPPPRPS
jgi:acyl-CoA thioesterase